MAESLDEDWEIVATALADGVPVADGSRIAAAFMRVVEDWVRSRVLRGPASDPSRCRLRPRFELLRDVHAGLDFVSEVILERLGHFKAGSLNDPDFRGVTRAAGMGRIASYTFLRFRAISFLGQQSSHGFVGMPEQDRDVASLDAGENGGLGSGIAAEDHSHSPGIGGMDLVRRLADGRPVVVLDLSQVTSAAILATAGLQLRRRLDPSAEATDVVLGETRGMLVVPEGDVEDAHDQASRSHRARIGELQQRRLDHPNMSRRTVEGIDRQITQTLAASILWPLLGASVASLFGLPSENAGQQRVSKYRKALPALLPTLASMLEGAGDDDGEMDESGDERSGGESTA